MTTKELLEKAKAKGGWSMRDSVVFTAKIRRGRDSCPIASVLRCKSSDAYGRAMAVGISRKQAMRIITTADNQRDDEHFDKKLRKEMESWCK